MKILHTADWHIGKLVNGVYMTEDQKYILEQIVEIIKKEKIDVVIIAGDLYDRSIPPVEAVELLDTYLSKILLEIKVPVIAISGNHDSADRLTFGNKILKDRGLYIEGKLKKEVEKVIIKYEGINYNFYLLPYLDPAEVREGLEDSTIKTHDDVIKAMLKNIELNEEEINIAIAHGYILGTESLEECDSERPLSIGGTEFIDVKHFEKFDYTALGHLHRSQRVIYDKVRYSGSILKYSFSEVNHKKGVVIVDIGSEGQADYKLVELIPLRDMRIIKGELKELLKPEVYENTNIEDYIHVVLTDDGELIDPMNKLREVYKNILSLERQKDSKVNDREAKVTRESIKIKSKLQLFKEFYTTITGLEFSKEKEEVVLEVLEEVNKLERAD